MAVLNVRVVFTFLFFGLGCILIISGVTYFKSLTFDEKTEDLNEKDKNKKNFNNNRDKKKFISNSLAFSGLSLIFLGLLLLIYQICKYMKDVEESTITKVKIFSTFFLYIFLFTCIYFFFMGHNFRI